MKQGMGASLSWSKEADARVYKKIIMLDAGKSLRVRTNKIQTIINS